MKLVRFSSFCALPDGTIFQEYRPHDLGPLRIRGKVLFDNEGNPIDFTQASLTPNCHGPGHMGDDEKYDPNALYIETPGGFARWGLYDKNTRFLIWEKQDQERLARWLLEPVQAINEMNNDPVEIIEVPWI